MIFLLKIADIPTLNPRKAGNGGIFSKADPRLDPRGEK